MFRLILSLLGILWYLLLGLLSVYYAIQYDRNPSTYNFEHFVIYILLAIWLNPQDNGKQ